MIEISTAGNQTEFARRIHVNQSTFHGYLDEEGQHRIKVQVLAAIAEAFGVDLNWLILGLGQEPAAAIRPETAEYGEAPDIPRPDSAAAPVSQGYDGGKPWKVLVCGPPGRERLEMYVRDKPLGAVTSRQERTDSGFLLEYRDLAEAEGADGDCLGRRGGPGRIALRSDLARDLLGEAENGVWLHVHARDLAPDVQPGDLALIDLDETRPEPGHLYAVSVQGLVTLRRLALSAGRWSLTTPAGDSMPYHPGKTSPGLILGRVVWIGRAV